MVALLKMGCPSGSAHPKWARKNPPARFGNHCHLARNGDMFRVFVDGNLKKLSFKQLYQLSRFEVDQIIKYQISNFFKC